VRRAVKSPETPDNPEPASKLIFPPICSNWFGSCRGAGFAFSGMAADEIGGHHGCGPQKSHPSLLLTAHPPCSIETTPECKHVTRGPEPSSDVTGWECYQRDNVHLWGIWTRSEFSRCAQNSRSFQRIRKAARRTDGIIAQDRRRDRFLAVCITSTALNRSQRNPCVRE